MINKERIIGLDILRSLAILFVLISHLFSSYLSIFGLWGVEIFFVLSGCLIGTIIINDFVLSNEVGKTTILNFWVRRWFRTLPNYYFFLIVFFLYYLFIQHNPFSVDLLNYIWFGQNLYKPIGGFFGVSWSLAIEEFFYLLFPFFIWLIYITKRADKLELNYKKRIFLITTVCFIVIPVLIRIFYSDKGDWDSWQRKIVVARLDAMMYGVLVAYITTFHPEIIAWFKKKAVPVLAIILIGCLTKILLKTTESSLYTVLYFTVLPIMLAIILIIVKDYNISNPFLRNTIMKISLCSYSVYLSHMLIFDVFERVFRDIEINALTKLLLRFGETSIIFVVSWILYKYFEVPVTKLRDKFSISSN
ncbi:acyltransferase family protein [Cytophaga aurantiaca]|uniref:acyltransferase family protein n=1 Tax=Cytophaga aurantiaca TaxID=29530 RepID=UPI0003691C3B|nr:acyltransferase [Cytophaga aurantiaca]